MHQFVNRFPLSYFTGEERHGIRIMCGLACSHSWRGRNQGLYEQWQFCFMAVLILPFNLLKCGHPAAQRGSGTEREDGVTIAITMSGNHANAPSEFSGRCTLLQEFACGGNNPVAIYLSPRRGSCNYSIYKCRN